ncbi:MAG: type VI secretion system contractile sheath large subunit, partial [Deltaproteobacteria bacterium]|nr:type VI secretion system contractile sheath large subunit [Deltaproteobacteria bacterium]
TIYESAEFRAFEASWRGLESLLKQGPVKEGQGVVVKVLPVDQVSLEATLNRLSRELADLPPNLILIDQPMDSTALGTALIEKITELAEDLLVPTACWVGADFFHLNNWSDLRKVQYLKHYIEDAAYAKFRKLIDLPGASWVTILLNRFIGRLPYGRLNKPKSIYFEESQPVWLSPVWALGAIAAQSVLTYGWPSRLTDYVNLALKDLLVTDLAGEGPMTTELALSEDRLMEFLQIGLTPLLGPLRKDQAFIPKEVTLAGGSLKGQLFVGRVLAFLFWCRENLAVTLSSEDLAGDVKNVLAQFWHRTGHEPPSDLAVTMERPLESGSIPLVISLTPSRAILPGGQKLEFTFVW